MKINQNTPFFSPLKTSQPARSVETQDRFQPQDVLETIKASTQLSTGSVSSFLASAAGTVGLQLACPLMGPAGSILHLVNSDGRFSALLQQGEETRQLACSPGEKGDSLMVGLPDGLAVLESNCFQQPKLTISAPQLIVTMTFEDGRVGDLGVHHQADFVGLNRSGRLEVKHGSGPQGFTHRSGNGPITHVSYAGGRLSQREATAEEIEILHQGTLRTIAQLT